MDDNTIRSPFTHRNEEVPVAGMHVHGVHLLFVGLALPNLRRSARPEGRPSTPHQEE